MKPVLLCFIVLSILSTPLLANAFVPQGRVVYESSAANSTYNLSLGVPEKINGVWTVERERKLTGELSRKTIEVDDSLDFDEVVESVFTTFNADGIQPLFYCAGLECGSSSAWASYRLGIKQLYGLDGKQHVWVWATENEYRSQYVTVYLVQRGNRRVYFQFDTLSTAKAQTIAPDLSVILNDLQRLGYYELRQLVVVDGVVQVHEDELRALRSALFKQPLLSLYVVGHDYAVPKQSQQARSLLLAKRVLQLLTEQGVQERRLEAWGIGAVAPEGRADAMIRVQLVVK